MKKYCIVIVTAVLGVICVLFVILERNKYDYTNVDMTVNNELNVRFTVEIEEDMAEFHICNNDTVDFSLGLRYGVEVWKNDKWEDIPRTGIWNAAAIYLTPGKEYIQEIPVKALGARRGRAYRIRKEINDCVCYSEVFIMK